jgi:hypothetical protein
MASKSSKLSGAIMRYKMTMNTAVIVSALLIIVAVMSACTIGTRSSDGNDNKDTAMNEFVNRAVFSEAEIEAAKLAVTEKFEDFKGCSNLIIWYDEDARNKDVDYYSSAYNVNGKDFIVLMSNFDVDKTGGDGSFNADTTYYDWRWLLTCDTENGDWKVMDWGY